MNKSERHCAGALWNPINLAPDNLGILSLIPPLACRMLTDLAVGYPLSFGCTHKAATDSQTPAIEVVRLL
jgi:hypothetical protein